MWPQSRPGQAGGRGRSCTCVASVRRSGWLPPLEPGTLQTSTPPPMWCQNETEPQGEAGSHFIR